ncbi:MAG: hypothetical protein H6707_16880 [Deltaproteobacteria bacterium]|nr:hypothetical protein [Deltaproteobacteria bacterium]
MARLDKIAGFLCAALALCGSLSLARADTKWLLDAADAAEKTDQAQAIRILRAALEIVEDPKVLIRLGTLLERGKRLTEAIALYERYITRRPEASSQLNQRIESLRLRETFAAADEVKAGKPETALAKQAFGFGRQAALKKDFEQGTRFLKAAVVLDPALPGPYRLLGAAYLKMGRKRSGWAHLADYLRIRPDGALASKVRKMLLGKGFLGTVRMTASFPADIWINGRYMGQQTPARVTLPEGLHIVTFVSSKYHLIKRFRVRVKREATRAVEFRFGIIEVALQPWARLRADDRDLGLWDALGLPEGNYQLEATSHDGKRKGKIQLTVESGRSQKLTWAAFANKR